MGYRAHVVKRQEEYADIEAFNWKTQEFKGILSVLGCNISGEEPYDRMELTKQDLKDALKIVKAYIRDGSVDEKSISKLKIDQEKIENLDIDQINEELDSIEATLGYTAEEFLETMGVFLKESDKKSEWVVFVWW